MKENTELAAETFENLPTANLKLDAATLEVLESSKVKNFIAPLLMEVHARGAQTVGVFSWMSEKSVKMAAQILTIAMAEQVDRRCALVVSEGLRVNVDNYDSFALVTLPETDLPGATYAEEVIAGMHKGFPYQVVVAPSIAKWPAKTSRKTTYALKSEAKFLLMPQEGYPRAVARQVERFTERHKIDWAGIVELEGVHA